MSTDNKHTILIVDDDAKNLSVLFEYLRRANYKVLVAESGPSALERVEHLVPDLILLDIMMPGMNGFETCQQLKTNEKTKNVPVIFITALVDTLDKVKAFEVGASDYITKPFEAAEVLVRINTHLTLHDLQTNLQTQNQQLREENLKRKWVQEALQESRMRYRLLAENATDMISRETLDGVYRYVSTACGIILGYEIEEMIGQSVYDYVFPDDLAHLKQSREVDISESGAVTTTYRARRKNNTYVWLETISRIVRDPETQDAEIVAVSRDITERKQMEQTLREQNQELDAFAHTVAHDLKNPLGGLIGYADLVADNYHNIPQEMILSIIEKIRTTSKQMNNIIDELLLLSGLRRGQVDLTPLDMDEVVAQALYRLNLMIERYEAKITYPDYWPLALGYSPWVEEIWANYVSNALKYGGEPPHMELGATPQDDGMIRFWVKDNGEGLTPDEQSRLFVEFVRLNEVRAEGHGLGLSIVRRIVDRLDGQVGVESTVGAGSEFYFTLPAAPIDSNDD